MECKSTPVILGHFCFEVTVYGDECHAVNEDYAGVTRKRPAVTIKRLAPNTWALLTSGRLVDDVFVDKLEKAYQYLVNQS